MKLNKERFFFGTVIIRFCHKSYQETNFKNHLNTVLLCEQEDVLSGLHMYRLILFHFTCFLLTFAIKLKDSNYNNH